MRKTIKIRKKISIKVPLVLLITLTLLVIGFICGYTYRYLGTELSEELVYPDDSVILFDMYEHDTAYVVENETNITSLPQSEVAEETEVIEVEPTEVIEEQTETVDNFHSHMSCDFDAEDAYLLMKIAMAEAEGEDTIGKALVMMVILNRVADNRFPDTIRDVIYQNKNGVYQFSPIGNGRFDRVEPNEDCKRALDMIVKDKWDDSMGALYFESCKGDSWHSRNLEFMFQHGVHRFYR